MRKIVLLGVGQLGSRHLQALALLKTPSEVTVIDPNSKSLDIANERWNQIPGNGLHLISFHKSIDNLKLTEVDLAIVATNANHRKHAVESLLASAKCTFLVLEKVLFQKVSEYYEVRSVLNKNKVFAYVNCPRRLFPSYIEIKSQIKKDELVHMEVVGNNWGLGCNGIHFIDLFNFLTGKFVKRWSSGLDNNITDSKRPGYKEFSGQLSGSIDGSTLTLTSFSNGPPSLSVRISTPSNRWVIAEGFGQLWHESLNNNWVTENAAYKMAFQSTLTNVAAEQLFNTGKCSLTSYNESMVLHLPYLKVLLKHLNKFHKTEVCPIT